MSSIIETTLAKHIVIVSKIYPEFQNTMEASKDKISETLLDVELSNFMSDLKNKISQEILDGYSLNEIANNNSLSIDTINNAERTFDTVEDDLARNEIVAKAFSSNKDFVSDIEDINSSQSIIINVDNIMFEKPYELNEVFEKVSNDWIKSLKIKEIENYIEESILLVQEHSMMYQHILKQRCLLLTCNKIITIIHLYLKIRFLIVI